MVLTPQLLQAIKLLQMPNVELTAFIENELSTNPLLERAEEREEANAAPDGAAADPVADAPREPGDWASQTLEVDAAGLAANLGTEVENAFEPDRTAPAAVRAPTDGLTANSWTGVGGGWDPAKRRTSRPMSPRLYRYATISSGRPRSCSPTRSSE